MTTDPVFPNAGTEVYRPQPFSSKGDYVAAQIWQGTDTQKSQWNNMEIVGSRNTALKINSAIEYVLRKRSPEPL